MEASSISLVAGTLLSLIFSYIPKASGSWEKVDPEYKRLIMLGLLVVVAGSVYGLACLGWLANFGISLECNQTGLFALVSQLIIAIIANQSTFSISPKYRRK